jgi:hypothetical protein
MCINLIPGHTYYEYLVWVLKPGMTVVLLHKITSTTGVGVSVAKVQRFWMVVLFRISFLN